MKTVTALFSYLVLSGIVAASISSILPNAIIAQDQPLDKSLIGRDLLTDKSKFDIKKLIDVLGGGTSIELKGFLTVTHREGHRENGVSGFAEADCESNEVLIGGGFVTSMQVSKSYPSNNSWIIYYQSPDNNARDAQAIAICISSN